MKVEQMDFFTEWIKLIDNTYDNLLQNESDFKESIFYNMLKRATTYDTLWFHLLLDDTFSLTSSLSTNKLFTLGNGIGLKGQGPFYTHTTYLFDDLLCYALDIQPYFKEIFTRCFINHTVFEKNDKTRKFITYYSFPNNYAFLFYLLICSWSSRVTFPSGTNYYLDFPKLSHFRDEFLKFAQNEYTDFTPINNRTEDTLQTDLQYNCFLFDVIFRYSLKKSSYLIFSFFYTLNKQAYSLDISQPNSLEKHISNQIILQVINSLHNECNTVIHSISYFSFLPSLERALSQQYYHDFQQINLSYKDFSLSDVLVPASELPKELSTHLNHFLKNISELAKSMKNWLDNKKSQYFKSTNIGSTVVVNPQSSQCSILFAEEFSTYRYDLLKDLENTIDTFLSMISNKNNNPFLFNLNGLQSYLNNFKSDFATQTDLSLDEYQKRVNRMSVTHAKYNSPNMYKNADCLFPFTELYYKLKEPANNVPNFFDHIPIKFSRLNCNEKKIFDNFNRKTDEIQELNNNYHYWIALMKEAYMRAIPIIEELPPLKDVSRASIFEFLQDNNYFSNET